MCFDLLGFDIMLDDELNPHIIEVNHAPSYNLDTPLDKKVKPALVRSLFDLLNLNLKTRK